MATTAKETVTAASHGSRLGDVRHQGTQNLLRRTEMNNEKHQTDSLGPFIEMPGDRFGVSAVCKDGEYGVSILIYSEATKTEAIGADEEEMRLIDVSVGFIAEANLAIAIERLKKSADWLTSAARVPPLSPAEVLRMIEAIRIAGAEIPRLREKGGG